MADPDTLQALRARFASLGDAPAIVAIAQDSAETLSFGALAARTASLGRALAQRGIGPGAKVALIGPSGLPWILAFWGIVASGAVAVPIDVQTNDEDLGSMLETASCGAVFAPASRIPRLPKGCAAIALDAELPSPSGESPPLPAVAAGDVAVVLFTSGTTGTPKAVPLTHANLIANARALEATGLVAAGDRAVLPLPLHHGYPLSVGLVTGLACGVALILPSGVSGPELMAALQRGGATVLVGVPRLYSALAAGIRAQLFARPGYAGKIARLLLGLSMRLRPLCGARAGRLLFRPLHRRLAPRLRLLVSGGAKLDEADEAMLGALGWAVMSGYGLTETTVILSFNRPGAARAGSAGCAIPGVALRIAAPGADGIGEIEAKGPSVFTGYLGDPAATRAAFTADGWFRTGDLGRIDRDGFLFIAARISETIVLADGKKLFPEAIEAEYEKHRLIREIALFAEGGALVGLVVPDLDAVRETGAVRMKDLLRDALADVGRGLPSHARLSGFAVARDKLPRTQLGKIRRHLVRPLYRQALESQAPVEPAALSPEDEALLARPEVAAAWRWLGARYPDRRLDLDMSPQLDLGIDSLGWVELTMALQRDLGASLTEREIARIVNLRDLLREVAEASLRPSVPTLPPQSEEAVRPIGPVLLAIQWVGGGLITLVMRAWFGLDVEGVERLPAEGAYLICANHESYLDPFAIVAALPRGRLRRTWWGGWTGILLTTAPRRLFSRAAQIVPVDADRGVVASLALAGVVLKRGVALVWFPEGGLTRDGKLQRFLPGVGVLVERHRVPVVPAFISGSYALWPVGQARPRRGKPIRLRFGPPLDPDALLAGPEENRAQRIADAVRAAVVALAEAVPAETGQ